MRKIDRSAIVPHSADAMFALVAHIESYPDFLPWCSDAQVHRSDEREVEASLELTRSGISKRFTTLNTLQRPESIGLALLDGPFRHLEGGWQFLSLGDDGCKVTLHLEFEFENPMTDILFGPIVRGNL